MMTIRWTNEYNLDMGKNLKETCHDQTFKNWNRVIGIAGHRYLTLAFLMVILAIIITAPQVYAQTPATSQEGPAALTGGTIYTVSQGVIEDGTILFEDGVITALGTDVDIPDGAEQIDVSGKQIYPGLVDAYSDMGLYEIGAVELTVDLNEEGSVNPNVRAQVAFNPESRHIGVARSSGVLTTVSTPSGGRISGLSAAMMLDGWTWEQMLLKPETGLIVNWPSAGNEDDYEEALLELRDLFSDARAYYKARKAMNQTTATAQRHDLDSRWEAMIPVFEGHVPVIVNADELRQIQDAITWAGEEDLRLILLGGRDAHYIANHLAEKQIPVILTTVLNSPARDWESHDTRYSLPAKLHSAGVPFAIAGSANAPNANRLAHEAGAAIAYGLNESASLRSVTLSPAEILGFDDRVGSLQTGKDATLMITDGHPLEYNTQIEQVYIQGRKIDMNDAHRQFYEKYRERINRQPAN